MPLHLIKMAVGVTDLASLKEIQSERRKARRASWFYTRNMPRRLEEVLDGGSIYWVIKGHVQARQRLVAFKPMVGDDGAKFCAVHYDPPIIATLWQPRRAFQGWRYLLHEDVPGDRPAGWSEADEPPADMAKELRALGLL
jgi:hypothetical protein